MKKLLTLLFLLSTFVVHAQKAHLVDPFIGTDGIVHTFPGATTPFGMIQLSPDGDTKGWNWCSGYHTSDDNIKGFSHNHLSGTGWSDLGDILVAATTGAVELQSGEKSAPDTGYRSRIAHDSLNEKAWAGYYMVNLLDYNIKAELTASPRVGFHRYTFAASDSANIIIDPTNKIFGQVFDTHTKVVGDHTIEGWCHSTGWGGDRKVYFVAQFSKPFLRSGDGKKAWASFSTKAGEQIEFQVALSHSSMEGARANLKAETMSFNKALVKAEKAWDKVLGNFEFDAVSADQQTILYTGLYHIMVQPNLMSDVNEPLNYSTFSFWDTFRAVHPLLTLVDHKTTADVVNVLSEREVLPLWELLGYDNTCMIGYPAVAVMGDAILKNIKGIDVQKAYQAMRKAAFTPYVSSSDGESGLREYIKFGYVPAGIPASVAKTMEYAYYDWVIARVAEKLGKTDDVKLFDKRSMSFLNHWRADKKLMWPKDSLGNWVEQDLRDWSSLQKHYVSGNVWAYSYFYPHAMDTMVSIMGGKEAFIANMDETLNTPLDMKGELHLDLTGFIGHYGHGDEPGHQFLYLYSMLGAKDKLAERVNEVSKMYYSANRDGMPNNDDCGQMSAWYIMSAMGFYPVTPGDGRFYIGAPMMNGATIKTASGKTFTMKAHNLSPQNIYVDKVMLNGTILDKNYITYDQIMNSGTLEFFMKAK